MGDLWYTPGLPRRRASDCVVSCHCGLALMDILKPACRTGTEVPAGGQCWW
jgi:hypothetical protein